MKNNITKYLIVLFGVAVFSFASNSASASVFYNPSENQIPVVNQVGAFKPATNPTPTVINNYYYYQTPPTTKTNATTTTSDNSSDKTASDPINNLGASALNSLKTAPALSMNGSGGFMPSSIWQWILVVILILTIIIIGRMFVHKPDPAEHDAHAH
jgi:hypothetical protein